jgi:hypothetical protein
MTVSAEKAPVTSQSPPPYGDIDGETGVYTRNSAVELARGSFYLFFILALRLNLH